MTRRALPLALLALTVPAGGVVAFAQTPDYQLPPAAQPGAAPEPDPEPQARRRALLTRVSGRVLYRPLGTKRYRVLREPRDLAFGAFVDARRGRVRITVERSSRGDRNAAIFYAGKFVLESQAGSPLVTTLRLAGGDFAEACEPAASAARVPSQDPAAKRIRRLWGDGKGRFRTRGRFSSATVRGTKWLTEDRCGGTLTRVDRGEVEVEDFTVTDPPPRSPETGGGGGGGTGTIDEGAGAPAPALSPGTTTRRRVRLRSGGTYTAAPR